MAAFGFPVRSTLVIGLLALAVPAGAHAQVGGDGAAGAQTEPDTATQSPELERLLDYLMNEADVIASATANYDAEFERNFNASGGNTAEARFPGITAVIANAGKQEMIAILRENYPGLRAGVATLVGQSLTPHDIDEANVFYGSPTGRKLVRAAIAGARGADIGALVTSGQAAAVDAMGPEDTAALIALTKTALYPKISVLGPRLQQSSADWASGLMTREAGRLQKAVESAGTAHIAGLQPRTGK